MEDVKLIHEKDTNKNTPMQDQTKKGNKGKKAVTTKNEHGLMIEEREHEGSSKNGLEASQHRTNNWNKINVYAGLICNTTRKTELELTQAINIEKILEYHLTKMGKKFLRGNQYYVIGFSSDARRTDFINNKAITNEIGKFMKLTDLDKINERHMISFLNIDGKSNFDEIEHVIEEKIGQITRKVNQWTNKYKENVTFIGKVFNDQICGDLQF